MGKTEDINKGSIKHALVVCWVH